MTETVAQERSDRPGGSRRRPLLTWVKKLRNNLNKGSSSGDDGGHGSSSKRDKLSTKKRPSKNNNPYPESGRIGNGNANGHGGGGGSGVRHSQRSFSTTPSGVTSSGTSLDRTLSLRSSVEGRSLPTAGARSTAATVSTDHEAAHSIAAPSHGASSVAGTSRTAGGGLDSRRGGDSTFSSPAPSVRSLTTTLTTIQSLPITGATNNGAGHAPNGQHNPHHHHGSNSSHHAASNSQVIHFNQPFPSTPASAIPPHLNPQSAAAGASPSHQQGLPQGGPGHPTTYTTATANGLLTDNASILTLASSSKRRRRRSLDTDASVRALAPSSLFGGSRDSLPLSVLSATLDGGAPSVPAMPGTPGAAAAGSSRMTAERTSIYSATGILAGSVAGDRSSYYAKQQQQQQQQGVDGASIRSGLLGHGRADSINGASPLASPREDPGGEERELRDAGNGNGNWKESGKEHENEKDKENAKVANGNGRGAHPTDEKD